MAELRIYAAPADTTAVDSVNGRIGAVTGLAEDADLDAVAATVAVEAVARAAADTALDARLDTAEGRLDDLEAEPSWTPTTVHYTPADLTMRAVHATRSQDPIPSTGPFKVLDDRFPDDNLFFTRYNDVTRSGVVSAETYTDGVLSLTATGAGALDRIYTSQTKTCVPSGVFAAVKIQPGTWSASSIVRVGFFKGTTGGEVFAYWNLNTGAVGASAQNGAIGGSSTTSTVTAPSTTPKWLALIYAAPEMVALTSDDGENWQVRGNGTTFGTSLISQSAWADYRIGFNLVPGASQTIAVSELRGGYAGALGYRDMKPVTYADGTPLQRDGLYYATVTLAHGAGFKGNHMGVLSIDPVSYQTELVSHLFWRVDSLGQGAGYGGQMVYDDGTWRVMANTWGFGDVGTGIDLIYATSTRDLLHGVHCTHAEIVTGLSSYSLYDCTIRRDDSGVWHMACVETDVRTGWNGGNHVTLFAGPSLTELVRVNEDTTAPVDGTNWAKIGGDWSILAGDSTSFIMWDDALENKVALTTWTSQLPSGLVSFGSFMAHPCPLVVDDEDRTRYLMLTYDGSQIDSMSATKGGLVVCEADEKPDGQEFQPRRFR